jgi:hypothetical protein
VISDLQFEFIDFEEAARPTHRRLYTLHVGDWWACHPEKGIAFLKRTPRGHRPVFHPMCNPVEEISAKVIESHKDEHGLEIRKIERAFCPVDFEGNYLIP